MIRLAWRYVPFIGYPYSGESAACNLCGSEARVPVCRYDRRLKRLTTVACSRCGVLRTDPMPTEDELARYYATEYRRDYRCASRRSPRSNRQRRWRSAASVLDLLRPVMRPGSELLDVGAGFGELLAAAGRAGVTAIGIEPGTACAEFARKAYRVSMVNLPWGRVTFERHRFDIVTMHHVLEHLRMPVDALAAAEGWLKDDGVIYVSVPDASPQPAVRTFELFHFAHVYGFTPRTLRMAARRCGLEPDPRFPNQGTTLVLRRRQHRETGTCPGPELPCVELPTYRPSSPFAYFAGGGWIVDAVRRLTGR